MSTSSPGNTDGSKMDKTKQQTTPTYQQATPKICVGGGSPQYLTAARREMGPSHIPVPNRGKYSVMDKVFPMARRGKASLVAERTSYDCLPSSLNLPADCLYKGMVSFRQPHTS